MCQGLEGELLAECYSNQQIMVILIVLTIALLVGTAAVTYIRKVY